VYLKPRALWKSAFHTARCCPGQNPKDPNSHVEEMTLVFHFGVARHVPKNVYDAFAAIGIATTERPRFTDDDED
jgi:hypothetical protein